MSNEQPKQCQNGCGCDFGQKADELRAESDKELDKSLSSPSQFRVDAQKPDWLERFMLYGFVAVCLILGGLLGWFLFGVVARLCS